ncbi:MAG: carbohydrate ABC transporter permease [Anaerolineae bacterium]|nr:carbohydrate ABC transporter permease [Anaerolineae bacterium]
MSQRKGYGGRTAVTLFIALLFVLPLLWMFSAALRPLGQPLTHQPTPLADGLTLAKLWPHLDGRALARFTFNSLLVVVTAVPLALLTGSWAGLGMARLPQASQRRWLLISLVVLMVPEISLWSTRFLVYKWLGWLDSHWALIATAWMGGGPFFVLMFYRAFRRIPTAVYDAARLDGARCADNCGG